MFTGIVEEAGTIERIRRTERSTSLEVRARTCARGVKVGDSVAVNGCCLTVVNVSRGARGGLLRFDLLEETWQRTSFARLGEGSLVNLERSLRATDRLGGHFVTGHIDGTGEIVRWEPAGADRVLEVRPPRELMKYLVEKGSVALDGMSLTVAEVKARTFVIWIIPHTLEVTNLRERRAGDLVNLEADLLGKYVERILAARLTGSRAPSAAAVRPRASRVR